QSEQSLDTPKSATPLRTSSRVTMMPSPAPSSPALSSLSVKVTGPSDTYKAASPESLPHWMVTRLPTPSQRSALVAEGRANLTIANVEHSISKGSSRLKGRRGAESDTLSVTSTSSSRPERPGVAPRRMGPTGGSASQRWKF
ncbi:unnamed protein product, partial [Polarella glacialis]